MIKLYKKIVLLFVDMLFCVISVFLSFYIILGPHTEWATYHASNFFIYVLFAAVIMVITLFIFGLYRIKWAYASIREMLRIILTMIVYNLVLFIVGFVIFSTTYIPIRVYLIYAVIISMFIMAIRASYRVTNYLQAEYIHSRGGEGGRIIIVGAGEAGTYLHMELKRNPERGQVIGFIDDDKDKLSRSINGVPILGDTTNIVTIAEDYDANEIIVALPSASSPNIKRILNQCTNTSCRIQIMPSLQEMTDESRPVKQLRMVEPEDLLGRDPVDLNIDEISEYISDNCILITGAGGSIGSELCRQIAKYEPKLMVLFDIYENNVFELEHELNRQFPDQELAVIIGSVRDINRLNVIFKTYNPFIVFHAAAHKHVPLMEFSPGEAVKNNVFGTKNVAAMADKYKADRFVLISTDKAVNPTNIMGATKRIAEQIISCVGCQSKTRFVAVRFGNVLGSNGSVIPHFKKQIAAGGPVTVTHPDVTRFFMTITEASQLVLQAGALAENGMIFVLDMGEMVKIDNLARSLINLSGFIPNQDIKIVYTGLRPGEKMYEELLTNKEDLVKTCYEKIFIDNAPSNNDEIIQKQLKKLQSLLDGDDIDVINMVKEMVPEFIEADIIGEVQEAKENVEAEEIDNVDAGNIR